MNTLIQSTTRSALYVVLVWAALCTSAAAQEWAMYFGRGWELGYAIEVVLDDTSNPDGYLVAAHTLASGAGAEDLLLLRLDEGGNILWQKTYGGSETE